jgi:hypothetical protein
MGLFFFLQLVESLERYKYDEEHRSTYLNQCIRIQNNVLLHTVPNFFFIVDSI